MEDIRHLKIRPEENGACGQDACPQFDGKRCRALGFRVDAGDVCEPYVKRLREDIDEAREEARVIRDAWVPSDRRTEFPWEEREANEQED